MAKDEWLRSDSRPLMSEETKQILIFAIAVASVLLSIIAGITWHGIESTRFDREALAAGYVQKPAGDGTTRLIWVKPSPEK